MEEFMYSGKSKEEVLARASRELKTPIDQLEYEVISEKKSGGFLGIGGTTEVELKITSDNSFGSLCSDLLREILADMGWTDLKIHILEDGSEEVTLDVTTEESPEFLTGKHGRVMDSLGFITSLIFNHDSPDWTKVAVDINGSKAEQFRMLKELAFTLAKTVQRTRREKIMRPLPPKERYFVHVTLKNWRGIRTVSEGRGVMKRIRIMPVYRGGGQERWDGGVPRRDRGPRRNGGPRRDADQPRDDASSQNAGPPQDGGQTQGGGRAQDGRPPQRRGRGRRRHRGDRERSS